MQLLWDYRNNPPRYADRQRWLRDRRPAVLAGHFALEEEVDAVAELVRAFLARLVSPVA